MMFPSPGRVLFKLRKDLFSYRPGALWRYLFMLRRHTSLGGGEFYVPARGKSDWRLYGDLQNVSHLLRYEWAKAVLTQHGVRSVLDLACGCGYGSHMLASAVSRVCGVDCNQRAIDYARKNFQKENLSFVCADIRDVKEVLNWLGEKRFDAIVSFDTIEHVGIKGWAKVFRGLLKDDGILLLSTPVRAKTTKQPTNSWHKIEYCAEDLLKELGIFGMVRYGKDLPYYRVFREANLRYGTDVFAQGPNPCFCEKQGVPRR